MTRHIFLCVLLLFIVFTPKLHSQITAKSVEKKMVYDLANVIDDNKEKSIEDSLNSFFKASHKEILVFTLPEPNNANVISQNNQKLIAWPINNDKIPKTFASNIKDAFVNKIKEKWDIADYNRYCDSLRVILLIQPATQDNPARACIATDEKDMLSDMQGRRIIEKTPMFDGNDYSSCVWATCDSVKTIAKEYKKSHNRIGDAIIATADTLCDYPEFILLIGGGLFLLIFSRAVSLRRLPQAIKVLREKQATSSGKETGQISSVQALLSAIAATVGMGNIAGVAVALTVGNGNPGVIFWMWVSALVGMCTKFFEGTLAIMYKGKDSAGEVQGGPMYIITKGLGEKWKPLAVAFAIFGLVGTLCVWQANQLVESVTTVFTTPMGIENTPWLRFVMGVVMVAIVAAVILRGIKSIAAIASKMVPIMVTLYLIMVLVIMALNYDKVPGVFASIFKGAFTFEAGLGGFAYVALTGARRAAYVNEAGIGTASMMHGASKNKEPVREGLIAMLGPAIDSGLICTLTAIPIIIAGNFVNVNEPKGLEIALGAWGQLIPHIGHYLLMVIVFFFAFSTMFTYSYYGLKCTNFLFGAKNAKYYNYYYLAMIVVAAVVPLKVVVGFMDIAFFLMACCTMTAIVLLSPKVVKAEREYFSKKLKK